MTIDGHECSVYCRPDEGLHCDIDHYWSYGRPVSPQEALDQMRRGNVVVYGGVPYPTVRIEVATEVPPRTREEANAVRRANGHLARPLGPESHWVAAFLVWFRTPVEASW